MENDIFLCFFQGFFFSSKICMNFESPRFVGGGCFCDQCVRVCGRMGLQADRGVNGYHATRPGRGAGEASDGGGALDARGN